MQDPKLVVFDVDGTLLNWDGTISEPTLDTLQRLRASGIPIALATGRPQSIAKHTLGQVGGADWMACGNGSVLFNVSTGAILRDKCLPDGVVEPTIRRLRDQLPGIGFAIEIADTLIEEPGLARRVPEDPTAPPVADALAAYLETPAPVRRLISYHDDYDDRLDELASIVAADLPDGCQLQYGGLSIVDISPAGEHKAVALEALVQHLGITAAEVLAFGDGGNDIEMLQWAGVGVAMGNARPEVQAAADHVTAHIEDDGVATFIESLRPQGM